MFSTALLRDLYAHMEWADALVWNAVMSNDAARADEDILDKLRHIHRTQRFFLKAWRGEVLELKKLETSVDDELALARTYYREANAFLETLSDADLARDLSVPWADRYAQTVGRERAEPTRLGETIYQAAAHTNYHRGQANTLLRQLDIKPPLVDYIAWLWLGRPVPQWPE